MALNAIYRPIEKWPGEPTPASRRKASPFKSQHEQTLNLLEHELLQLAARNVVIQLQVEPWQIRNDGLIKGGVKPSGPAVLLAFTSGYDGQQYSYPCDNFTEWSDNLRAIALALEALRKVDRYGVTRRGEQYQGFRALPAGETSKPKMLPDEAASFIATKVPGVEAHAIATNQTLFEVMFKMLQQQLHPDKGGSHEDFVQLQEAGAVLTEFFKKAKGAAR